VQKIISLTSVEDRLIFELENMGRQTIEQMLAAVESYPDFRIVTRETLTAVSNSMTLGAAGSSVRDQQARYSVSDGEKTHPGWRPSPPWCVAHHRLQSRRPHAYKITDHYQRGYDANAGAKRRQRLKLFDRSREVTRCSH
jgi:hypothetical protein